MKRFDTINVIPFIDIMLVLLAIVLTTATFLVESRLEIELPKTDGTHHRANLRAQEITIDRNGRFYLNDQAVELEELRGRLANLPQETPITLRVDAGVPFARFVNVAEMTQDLGLRNLGVITEGQR
ncbi:biopolymer transport protein [Thioploca ingrica]|uniref:Biopolymer transport protein n=1 Tax=Thioploca ingrica TaxID=40754 RepID=A0A090BUP4_9GAMM|nr:biopolymer transport protein [Thioploca ingrica]